MVSDKKKHRNTENNLLRLGACREEKKKRERESSLKDAKENGSSYDQKWECAKSQEGTIHPIFNLLLGPLLFLFPSAASSDLFLKKPSD